jgi:quercetin dioxygenase-like cupin family protein
MGPSDEGGETACWANLTERHAPPVVVDMGSVVDVGGAVWSLRPEAPDTELDVNLIRLAVGASIGVHVNAELDVLIVIQSGSASVVIDADTHELQPGMLVFVPKGARRGITAGDEGCGYLSIHRRRGTLDVFRR